jgi:hypothetical protein
MGDVLVKKQFVIYDATGRITQAGPYSDAVWAVAHCRQNTPVDGGFLLDVDVPDVYAYRVESGALTAQAVPYDVVRKREYPPISTQLDALWHAMDAGEIPKATKFYDDIKKIKDKYPKP